MWNNGNKILKLNKNKVYLKLKKIKNLAINGINKIIKS